MCEISYLQKLKLGAHQSFNKTIFRTIKDAINGGMYSVQLFLGSTNLWKRNEIKEEDIMNTLEILQNYKINIFSHFPYTSNMCGSKDSLAWCGDSIQDNKTISLIKFIEKELNVISRFNRINNCNSGVVIHPGSYKNRKLGLETISKTINKINFKENSMLLLENTAGQGDTLAIDLEELNTIYTKIKNKENIGICIDTCHIYASGKYNLSEEKEVERLFSDFINTFGIEKLKLIHLNDSEKKFGSRVDRHASLGSGCIWKDNIDSLLLLLSKCIYYNIPIILETCYYDIFTVSKLEKLIINN